MDTQALTLLFGLASAFVWGAGDFSGGLATKRGNVYSVVLISQIAGGVFLAFLALVFHEAVPPAGDMLFGALAGVAGVIGLSALYSGLAQGRMGIVAPLTAVIAATMPVLYGLITEGVPPILQIAGFGLALIAVWLLSGASGDAVLRRAELGYAFVAGAGFALFFILIDQANEAAIYWPLTAARVASVTCLAIYITVRGRWRRPERDQLPLIVLAGLLDALGNAFFALSARFGRLDLAAILASLYPASTVLLARIVLHERLNSAQWLGVLTALLALILIAV
jgi:drug/metabolite transporter (DMT)-like permease